MLTSEGPIYTAPTIDSTVRRFAWLTGSRGPAHLVDLATFRSVCGSPMRSWQRAGRPTSCMACVTVEGRLKSAASHRRPGQ